MQFQYLPCPCCGAQAFLFENQLYSNIKSAYVECSDCGVGTPEISYDQDDQAAIFRVRSDLRKIWNRRQQLVPIVTTAPRRCSAPRALQ